MLILSGSRGFWLKPFCAVVLIAGMVGVSEWTGEREVIFPEIAALVMGLLVTPRLPWRMTLTKMVLALSFCATMGLGISVFVPGPLVLKIVLAYGLSLLVLMASGTTFAPMIAAAVMPVLLGITGWIYPVSATALAVLCALVRAGFERANLVHAEFSRPHRGVWGGPRAFCIRLAGVGAVAACATSTPALFLAAPPLLVAYTQLSRRRNPLRRKPWKVVFACVVCAVFGVCSRGLVSGVLGLPLVVGAVLAVVAVIVFLWRIRVLFPPAAAMAVIAFLVPEAHLPYLPLEAGLSIAFLAYYERLLR